MTRVIESSERRVCVSSVSLDQIYIIKDQEIKEPKDQSNPNSDLYTKDLKYKYINKATKIRTQGCKKGIVCHSFQQD